MTKIFVDLRPVLLLPPATAMGLTPQQFEALLGHELAHMRRHDYIVNAVQMVVETLFFYHPAIWWASKRIRVERELCCDDVAVSSCGDAFGYAQALTRVARMRVAGLAMGAGGGPLLRRSQRLLGAPAKADNSSPAWLIAGVLVTVLALTITGGRAQTPGQTAPLPQFDVASVKLNTLNEQPSNNRQLSPGRTNYHNSQLVELIKRAFGDRRTVPDAALLISVTTIWRWWQGSCRRCRPWVGVSWPTQA